jgi:signal transduction histidine kinase
MIWTSESPIRLLLVEDERTSAESMTYMLRKREIEVTHVEDASAAIRLFSCDDFDIVLADIRLPGELTGADILDHVRDLDADFPVILVTGYDDIQSAIRAIQRRASDYILKPVDKVDDIAIPVRKAVNAARLAAENRRLYGKLRQLASETIMTEERERRRIARDLHDSLGQSLFAISLALQTGLKVGGTRMTEEATRSYELATESITQIREMTFELSPPSLYDIGLEAAVTEYAARTTTPDGPAIEVCCETVNEMPPEAVRILLYRSIRELIHNAIKHAQASRITVTIKHLDHQLQTEVSDNGIGFDTAAVEQHLSQSGGLGLFSIRERIGELGGKMELFSSETGGAVIRLRVPITEIMQGNVCQPPTS